VAYSQVLKKRLKTVQKLTKVKVPEELTNNFVQIGEAYINVKTVKVQVTVSTMPENQRRNLHPRSIRGNKKAEKIHYSKFKFRVIVIPKYRVEALAEKWEYAEDLLQKVGQSIITNVTKSSGQGFFK